MFTHLKHINYRTIVDGYIRENYGDNFVNDISHLCYKYFNEIFLLTFDEKAIKKIKFMIDNNNKKEKAFGNGTINIRGIDFKYYIFRPERCYPPRCYVKIVPCNGTNRYSPDFCLVYEIYSPELKIGEAFHRKFNEIRRKESAKKFPRVRFDEKSKKYIMHMRLAEILDDVRTDLEYLETLTFWLYADFAFIADNNNKLKIYHDIKLSRSIEYKWEIDDNLADKLINAKQGDVFYSDNFGNGEERNVYNQYGLYLELIPKCKNGGYRIEPKYRSLLLLNVKLYPQMG